MRRGIVIALCYPGVLFVLCNFNKARGNFACNSSLHELKMFMQFMQGDTVYYRENGREIKIRNKQKTGKVAVSYVVKTVKMVDDIYVQTETDRAKNKNYKGITPIDVCPITNREKRMVIKMIKDNDLNNPLIRINTIEIMNKGIMQMMFNKIPNDGSDSCWYREYGGIATFDGRVTLEKGKANDPCLDSITTLMIHGVGKVEYHSHPAGYTGNEPPRVGNEAGYKIGSSITNSFSTNKACWFMQGPSNIDKDALTHKYGYVFAMRHRIIYIYDRCGIVATLPMSFVMTK